LEDAMQKYNAEGWNCHRVMPHETRDILVKALQAIVLLPGAGLSSTNLRYRHTASPLRPIDLSLPIGRMTVFQHKRQTLSSLPFPCHTALP